jgi:hypothetical protein
MLKTALRTGVRAAIGIAVLGILAGHLTVGLHGQSLFSLFAYSGTIGFMNDPALGSYGGSEPGQLLYPSGIAVGPQNRIHVADSQNNRIQVFNADGTLFANFGSIGDEEYPDLTPDPAFEFNYPSGVVVDSLGNLLVTDSDNHRLQLYRPKKDLNGNQIVGADGMAQYEFVKAVGGFYDTYDPANQPLLPIAQQGFNYPTRSAIRPGTRLGDATDTTGRVVVADSVNHRLVILNSSLTPISTFGQVGLDGNGPADMDLPWGVGMDLNRIFVADSDNHRIQIFDFAGNILSVFGSLDYANNPGDFEEPYDVQPDAQGRLIIADRVRSRVLVLTLDPSPDPARTVIPCSNLVLAAQAGRCEIVATDELHPGSTFVYDAQVLGGPTAAGTDTGKFVHPQSVAADSQGRLLVLDTEGHRIGVFRVAQVSVAGVSIVPGGPVVAGQTVSVDVAIRNDGADRIKVFPQVEWTLVSPTLGTRTGTLPTPAKVYVNSGASASFSLPMLADTNGQLTFAVKAKGQPEGLNQLGEPIDVGLPITSPSVAAGPVTVNPALGAQMTVAVEFLGNLGLLPAAERFVGIGSSIPVRVSITNSGTAPLVSVVPFVDQMAGAGLVSGVSPLNVDPGPLAPDATRNYDFIYTAVSAGIVNFTGRATAEWAPTPGTRQAVLPSALPTVSVEIKSDNVKPTTTVLNVTPGPAASGWYLQPITVTLQASDNTSVKELHYSVSGVTLMEGTVPGPSASIPIPYDGSPITLTYYAVDTAGNREADKTAQFKIDKQPPQFIGASVDHAPNWAGWTNFRYPTVRFGFTDKLGQPTPPVVTLQADGANQTVSVAGYDTAGNSTPADFTVSVDTVKPAVVCTPAVAPTGTNGWFNAGTASVTVNCQAVDQSGLSGILYVRAICPATSGGTITTSPVLSEAAPKFGPATATASCTITADGVHTVYAETSDVAGNQAQSEAVAIKIDRTPPTVACGTVTGGEIWPPNHKMEPWITAVKVTDPAVAGLAGSGTAGFRLVAYSSTEEVNWLGDANTPVDMAGWVKNVLVKVWTPGVTAGYVRSERSGPGTGRIYRLKYEGLDLAGNVTTCTSTLVEVPHDIK